MFGRTLNTFNAFNALKKLSRAKTSFSSTQVIHRSMSTLPSWTEFDFKHVTHSQLEQAHNEGAFNPNDVNQEGETLAHQISKYGRHELVEPLKKMGVNFEKSDKHGRTPLEIALDSHNTTMVETLTTGVQPKSHHDLPDEAPLTLQFSQWNLDEKKRCLKDDLFDCKLRYSIIEENINKGHYSNKQILEAAKRAVGSNKGSATQFIAKFLEPEAKNNLLEIAMALSKIKAIHMLVESGARIDERHLLRGTDLAYQAYYQALSRTNSPASPKP